MRRVIMVLAAVAGLGGLLVAVDPGSLGRAVSQFDALTLVPLLGLVLAFYLLQGLRWHLLLRAVGGRGRVLDSQLINMAGQAISAVLPMGDVTRAVMASRTSGVDRGATLATVAFQELSFMFFVVLAAAPGLARLPEGLLLMLVLLGGLGTVVLILTVAPVFNVALRALRALPWLRRFAPEIATMQREVRRMLRRPDVAAGALLDLARVVVATAALLLVLRGLHITSVGWWNVALVLAASFAGGALSFLPGGVGANEATVVGVLMLIGVHPAAAAAAAILQRLSLTVVPVVAGGCAYLLLRHSRTQVSRPARSAPVPTDIHALGRTPAPAAG